MKTKLFYLFVSTLFFSCSIQKKIEYPVTKKVNVVDTYFNVEVPDPYRWLEDDNSEETKQWVDEQNEVTFAYLNSLPNREKIKTRLTEIWNYPKQSTPFLKAGKYFYSKNDGLQNQDVLYITEDIESEGNILLDPNKLSDDGTVALSSYEISPDAKYLIYMIARSGSDWKEIFVKNIETDELLPDHIKWVKYSETSWYDNGFYYCAYPEPAKGDELKGSSQNHRVKYHKINTNSSEDKIVYEEPENPKRLFSVAVTDDEKYIALYKMEASIGNALSIKDISKKNAKYVPLIETFDNEFLVADNIGEYIFVRTNYKAPNYQLLRIDMSQPQEEYWEVLIPEKENVMQQVELTGGKIMVQYMKDASSKIEVFDINGNYEYEIELPGIGTVEVIKGKKDNPDVFYYFTSFNTPGEIYKYNIDTKETTLHFRPEVKFNPDELKVDQVFCASKDGTRIPIFLFYKKGMVQNGKNPTLLFGYGGFNISQTPYFSISRLAFVENGGLFALANLRGGGEYGDEWHISGTKLQKQNVFDDFIAAGEFLVDQRYTNPGKLAIMGGSNGGTLVGAVTNQRPDLIKVAIPLVGVMDMLRYHKFTIGWAWAGDYGTSNDSKEMFEYLYKYSPYHNIQKMEYPAILAGTADHDDRVVPAHTFKYMARLQELNQGNLPVLVRIDKKAGHGGGKPTSKIIEEYTDMWAFLFYQLGMEI